MDWDAPLDAWYVWMAVALVSLAVAGVALAVPTGPPPDANGAANAIDRIAASPYQASGSYAHDGDEVRVTARTIELRNRHGTSHATVSFGTVVPASGVRGLENVTYGAAYENEYDEPYVPPEYRFLEAVDDAASASPEWRPATGDVVVRRVTLDSRLLEILDRVSVGPVDGPEAVTSEWQGVQYDRSSGEFYVVLVAA
ncbi:hypothetical protein ACFQS4_04660 [Saliphagus sp. GCM10025317]